MTAPLDSKRSLCVDSELIRRCREELVYGSGSIEELMGRIALIRELETLIGELEQQEMTVNTEQLKQCYLEAHLAVKEWTHQRQEIRNKKARLEEQAPEQKAALNAAEEQKKHLVKRFAIGEATEQDLDKAWQEYTRNRDQFEKTQELLNALQGMGDNDNAFMAQKNVLDRELAAAQRKYCDEIAESIMVDIRKNQKLKDELTKAFVAWGYGAKRAGYNYFVEELFEGCLDDAQFEKQTNAFEQQHIIPLIGEAAR